MREIRGRVRLVIGWSLFRGGIDKMILIDYYFKIIELAIKVLPFIGIIITIYFTSNENKEERKFRKKEKEKRFLKEKLEIIIDEIMEDYLSWSRIYGNISSHLDIEETRKQYSYEKSYKKAILLGTMYFPELDKLIEEYEGGLTHLETYMNVPIEELKKRDVIELLENEIKKQFENKRRCYVNIMNSLEREIERINNM